MSASARWSMGRDEQHSLIISLTEVLAPLRAKAGISQGELAYLVGVSRQTISMIECGRRPMSWSTYLALAFFFDSNRATHRMIRDVSAFPEAMIERFNDGAAPPSGAWPGEGADAEHVRHMLASLDAKGLHSLETVLALEYSRCTGLPPSAVARPLKG